MSELYTGRTWSVPLPPNVPLITANDRLTVAGRITRTHDMRDLGGWLAIKHRLPRHPPVQFAHVIAFILVTDNRRYDPANWQPTAKALLDGMVKAGVFPDDDHTHILGPDPRIRPGQRSKGFMLYIREMNYMPEELDG